MGPGRWLGSSPLSHGPVLDPWPSGSLLCGLGLTCRTPQGYREIMWAWHEAWSPVARGGAGTWCKELWGEGARAFSARTPRGPTTEQGALPPPHQVPWAHGWPRYTQGLLPCPALMGYEAGGLHVQKPRRSPET